MSIAFRSAQPFFPILHGGVVIGVVHRSELIKEAATADEDDYISAIMSREIITLDPDDSIETVLSPKGGLMSADCAVVISGGKLLGIITRDTLIEHLFVHSARGRETPAAGTGKTDTPHD